MSKKILLIDDDKTTLLLLKSRLEAQNFQIVVAQDGDIGLEKVKAEKPDLIILDVEMPRMNGYTFLNELKKMDGANTLPVIVLTTHSEVQPIFSLKGVKGYFIKPLKIEPLLEKIIECLGPLEKV